LWQPARQSRIGYSAFSNDEPRRSGAFSYPKQIDSVLEGIYAQSMEMILWLLFSAAVVFTLFKPYTVIGWFKGDARKWRDKPTEKVEQPPVRIKTQAELHAEEHKDWMDKAWAIIRESCKEHIYHHQNWYKCINCGQEEPWVWKEGCECRYEEVHTFANVRPHYALVFRRPNCRHHGKDYTSWPLSERKGNVVYGRQSSDRYTKDAPYEKGQALQSKVRKVRFEIPEGN